ncbi:MAG: hypothetical protein HQK51_14090 [Oligoflexia bacterium]|nr:hypothetical protein [Oligoflexia bacterium]
MVNGILVLLIFHIIFFTFFKSSEKRQLSLPFMILWSAKSFWVLLVLHECFGNEYFYDVSTYIGDGIILAKNTSFLEIVNLLINPTITIGDSRGGIVTTIFSAFIFSIFKSSQSIEIIFAGISLLGYYYLLSMINLRYKKNIYFLIFFPTSFFFLSLVCKDLIIFVSFCGYLYHSFKLFQTPLWDKRKIVHLSFVIFWCLVANFIRFWCVSIFILSSLIYLWVRCFLSQSRSLRIFSIIQIIFAFIVLFISMDAIDLLIKKNSIEVALISNGGSANEPFVFDNFISYLSAFPFVSPYTFFSPFLHHLRISTGIMYEISICLNVVLLLLTLYVLFLVIVNKYMIKIKSKFTNVQLYLSSAIVSYLFVYYPVFYVNFGAGTRFKAVITPIVLILLFSILETNLEKLRTHAYSNKKTY